MLVEGAGDGVMVADMRSPGQALVYVNSAFEQITGYRRAEVLGKNCRYLQGNERLQPELDRIREAFDAGEPVAVTLRNYRRDGMLFWNQLRLIPVRDERGVSHYVGFMRDITDSVVAAERLANATQLDRLTSVLNRDALLEALRPLCARGVTLVVKVDVARFQEVNSAYGYRVGDALLQEIAHRLRVSNPDLIARSGSNEFIAIFALERREDAPARLEALLPRLEERYLLSGADLQIRIASGFMVADAGVDPLVLLSGVGEALSRSKRSFLRRPCEFDAGREEHVRKRLRLTAELQHAVAADEFDYHFQPKVDLADGRAVGAEALLRWRHGLFGLQQPSAFIALAEETGLILDIGAQGLPKVADFAVRTNAGRATPLTFAVNLSIAEFTHRDIVGFVSEVMERSGADPAWFILEITESLMAEDYPQLVEVLGRLRRLGVGLSIDDFGAGYSSLRYLEQLPVNEVKLDRSFVSELDRSRPKRVIAQSVIHIAESVGLAVVAEGIEREAELQILRDLGCRLGQGYFFSPPVAADAFSAMVREG